MWPMHSPLPISPTITQSITPLGLPDSFIHAIMFRTVVPPP
jgi:hypothetical protein